MWCAMLPLAAAWLGPGPRLTAHASRSVRTHPKMATNDPDFKIAELRAQLELAQIETARAKAAVADAKGPSVSAVSGGGDIAVVPTILGLGAAGFLARGAAISSAKAREARQEEEARQAKAQEAANANANVGGVAIAAIAAATVAAYSGGAPSDVAMETTAPAVLEEPVAKTKVVGQRVGSPEARKPGGQAEAKPFS